MLPRVKEARSPEKLKESRIELRVFRGSTALLAP